MSTSPSADGLPTDALAKRAQAGDSPSFDAVWGRVAPSLFAWASLHIRPALRARLDPEDLLQEVACRGYARFETWDERRGPFRAWIFGIARNVLRDAFRRLSHEPGARGAALPSTELLASLPDMATAHTRAVARDEDVRRFVQRCTELPEEDQRLLMFRGLEGLSHAEVAALLSLSPDAVAKRWQRLCDRLRAEPRWSEIVAA
ncbi:MAG TPA: sigma-70 family RNA polymerase sigma factor [Planctomycetota bacterium]|nr:sigma-70 family RNA polymerase sigma factor [Planctomycetota bacterium]